MFSSLSRGHLSRKRNRRSSNKRRRPNLLSALGGARNRSLRHETLEDRRVLALLGVEPLSDPVIGYNVSGTVDYDSSSDLFSLDGTPTTIDTGGSSLGLFAGGDVDINILIDDTGALIGGTSGDDLIISGDVDLDGDFSIDLSGTLLTGEIVAFGFEDSGGSSDLYDFRFEVTGGLLAGDFVGKEIGVTTTSEGSTFIGDFSTDFGGEAKGEVGAIDPLADPEPPKISYDVDGTVSYDADSDLYSIDATPTTINSDSGFGFFAAGDLDVNFVVDDSGTLVSGVGGDDFVLAGDVDLNGDFVVDASGVLLTGEVIDFSATDSGGSSDTYEIRIAITGGLLAGDYGDSDLLMEVTSESSTFAGDFTVDFGGEAKGQLCAVDPIIDERASIGNYVFIDKDENGLQSAGDLGVNGVTVNLLNDDGILIASTVTDFDDSGNAGFYLFYNLVAGEYFVEFEVPEGVAFTTKDVDANASDTLDSDVNVDTGVTDVIAVADGEHRRDIDAGLAATVTVEETVYKVEDYFSKKQNAKAGKIKGVTIEYGETSEELFVSVDFAEYRGRLTDGFTIVITPDDWPVGDEGEYAMLYFDGDIFNRHGGPVLTVYTFNGTYDGKSFLDGEEIATSLDNSSGWVQELSVETQRVHGRWHRTMSFTIDAGIINDFVGDADWIGAAIGDMANFMLDTYDGLYTKYDHDGFLKKWWACRHGWLDADWLCTEECIVTTEEDICDFVDAFGWVTTEFAGDSDGDPPTDEDDEESDLDWAGSVDAALEEEFA